jgi:hypothetical protein
MVTPPTDSIKNVLRVRAEVVIELIMKLCGFGHSESGHVVEVIFILRRARHGLSLHTHNALDRMNEEKSCTAHLVTRCQSPRIRKVSV